MDKQQIEAIRTRDAATSGLWFRESIDPTMAESHAAKDRRALLAAYDALTTLLRAARQDLVVWEAAHGMKGETTTPALIASIDAAIGTASQPTAREDADHG